MTAIVKNGFNFLLRVPGFVTLDVIKSVCVILLTYFGYNKVSAYEFINKVFKIFKFWINMNKMEYNFLKKLSISSLQKVAAIAAPSPANRSRAPAWWHTLHCMSTAAAGSPSLGDIDIGASGSKAPGLWPLAFCLDGRGSIPETAGPEQALMRPGGVEMPAFLFTQCGSMFYNEDGDLAHQSMRR